LHATKKGDLIARKKRFVAEQKNSDKKKPS